MQGGGIVSKLNLCNLNVTIVGLGLIGGSIAKAIRKNIDINNLWAVDVDKNVLNIAFEEGIINEGFIDPKIPLADSDVTIFCTYPVSTIEIIKENANHFKPNSIVTDTSGIKETILQELKDVLRQDVEFIGGHPMSGKESRGYEFSNENIFNSAEYILTPDGNTSDHSIKILTHIIKSMGFKKITIMSPEIHDKRIAFTSQLPHVIACALMNNRNIKNGFNCIGGSLRDMTRVADINSELWCQLLSENKRNILDELEIFMLDITNIYDILMKDDVDKLRLMMNTSSMLRKEMIK